jgi:hypothetical protein
VNKALEERYEQWRQAGVALQAEMWEGYRRINTDWYDHRLDWMLMLSTCNDFWLGSVYNVMPVMPMGGTRMVLRRYAAQSRRKQNACRARVRMARRGAGARSAGACV